MTITSWSSFLSIAVLVTAAYCNLGTAYQIPDEYVFCPPLWQNCDKNASNGCEANVAYDDLNCGFCGTSCYQNTERKAPPFTKVHCTNGICTLECMYNRWDCDMDFFGTGCEIDLLDEDMDWPEDCGDCMGRSCHKKDPYQGLGPPIPEPPQFVLSDGNLQVQFVRGIPKLVAVVSLIGYLIIFA